jgi:hypothetical protein
MAKKPTPTPESPNKKLAEELKSRLTDAVAKKSEIESELSEAYLFTKPRLHRQVGSGNTAKRFKPKDNAELATSIGTEVNEDFATELINAFLPPHFPWAESRKTENIPQEVWDQVKDAAKAQDGVIFDAIRSSNFDSELATALVPEAGLGTIALWIEDREPHEPIHVMHVPLRELELNLGPLGTVDDRFAVRQVRGPRIRSVLPKVTLPAKVLEKEKKNDSWVKVVWGYWRDWSITADVVWRYVCMADDDVVETSEYRGAGSCPLVVARFSPDSINPFGNGPTLDSLPDLRCVDRLALSQMNRADVSMDPPFAYPDDSIISFEEGIESGRAYPHRVGITKDEFVPLHFQGDVNLGLFTVRDLERAIRRKHFADYPDQEGKTPPTATQWIDEMVKSQRRIGTPGQKFWAEGPAEYFLRFRYLLEKRGLIAPLKGKEGSAVSIRPSNPATKAQEQQEVQVGMRLVEIIRAGFPQVGDAIIEPIKTIQNFKEKLGDQIVELRGKEEMDQMIQQMLQLGAQAIEGGGEEPTAPA